jgi:hypothetical protein
VTFSIFRAFCISNQPYFKPQNKAVILRAVDFFAFAQKRSLSLEKAVVDGEGVPAVPTTAFTLDNGPLPFNNPLLFVIPSEAEGSAVRHSGALNLPFHNHFPFVILRACDFLDLSSSRISNQLACELPNRIVILSGALRGSIANRELYGAQSKDPGDACLHMLSGAFPPRTTT